MAQKIRERNRGVAKKLLPCRTFHDSPESPCLLLHEVSGLPGLVRSKLRSSFSIATADRGSVLLVGRIGGRRNFGSAIASETRDAYECRKTEKTTTRLTHSVIP
jgi:hypothetical protein